MGAGQGLGERGPLGAAERQHEPEADHEGHEALGDQGLLVPRTAVVEGTLARDRERQHDRADDGAVQRVTTGLERSPTHTVGSSSGKARGTASNHTNTAR